MRIITVTIENGVVTPDEPLPQDSIANVFDDEKYVIYEEGDELPPEPVHDEQL